MKNAALIVSLLCALGVSHGASSTGSDFLTFRPAVAQKFGLTQAQALADAERVARYGACGLSIFKERRGALWIFETKVGWGGSPAPDIVVFEPLPSFTAPSQGNK